MRYEDTPDKQPSNVDRVFAVINFILVLIIAFCVNVIIVRFLFR